MSLLATVWLASVKDSIFSSCIRSMIYISSKILDRVCKNQINTKIKYLIVIPVYRKEKKLVCANEEFHRICESILMSNQGNYL